MEPVVPIVLNWVRAPLVSRCKACCSTCSTALTWMAVTKPVCALPKGEWAPPMRGLVTHQMVRTTICRKRTTSRMRPFNGFFIRTMVDCDVQTKS